VAYRDLLGHTPARVKRLAYSPSCYLMLAGTDRSWDDGAGSGTGRPAHHTIHFGNAWREVFDELLSGRLMTDPSVLVTRPTVSDPSLAPDGKEIHYILFPTPNLDT
jgi:phytoene desaturase